MSRNRMITEYADGTHKDEAFNAPAHETENARVREIGSFRQDNVAASQSAVALTYQSIAAGELTSKVAGKAGKILGLAWQLSAAITGGVATIRPTIDGTAVGTAVSLVSAATVSGVVTFAEEIAYAEGQKLGVKITTDGSATPTTSELGVDLIVRMAA